MKRMWPRIRSAMDYAISTWDPRETGFLKRNTTTRTTSIILAPTATAEVSTSARSRRRSAWARAAGDDVARYRTLLAKGRRRMETELFNGEYFIQIVKTDGLAKNFSPINPDEQSAAYRDIARRVTRRAEVPVRRRLPVRRRARALDGARLRDRRGPRRSRKVLSTAGRVQVQPQTRPLDARKPATADLRDGGRGRAASLLVAARRKPLLPFVYSDEVWTGIEYQVAAHLILLGRIEEGLDIVRTCRARYDGIRRNPFDEYECGHWYARALASYALMQAFAEGAK
jgi:hypothetical protein